MDFNEYLNKVLGIDKELQIEYNALELEYQTLETMIRASNRADFTKNQLLDVYLDGGLIDVYNLGMKHMYEYLEGKNDKQT